MKSQASRIAAVTALLALIIAFAATTDGWATTLQEEKPAPECRLSTDPIWTGGASLLLPGLGQIFNKDDGKALIHVAGAVAIPTILGLGTDLLPGTVSTILSRLTPLIYLGWAGNSAVDAYSVHEERCH